MKDLGVKMSDSAKFENNIDKCVKKGNQYTGWILRSFRTRDNRAMMTLFRAMVLPHLEYCCQLWSPVDKGQIRQIEAIQRRFTSKLSGLETLDYWKRLEVLNLYSLERRRERCLIIYVYKIINGIVPNLKYVF